MLASLVHFLATAELVALYEYYMYTTWDDWLYVFICQPHDAVSVDNTHCCLPLSPGQCLTPSRQGGSPYLFIKCMSEWKSNRMHQSLDRLIGKVLPGFQLLDIYLQQTICPSSFHYFSVSFIMHIEPATYTPSQWGHILG